MTLVPENMTAETIARVHREEWARVVAVLTRRIGDLDIAEEMAADHGKTMDRNQWRLVGQMHIAETKEQAYKNVEFGIEHWFNYFQKVAAFPQMAVGGGNVREMIDFVNDSGLGSIGTAAAKFNAPGLPYLL